MTETIQHELNIIRNAAAFSPITNRSFLRITGSDATRWLNGMVTNNIKDLAPGQGNYNFLLNSQGRIQGDCTIYRDPSAEPSAYLLSTDAAQGETIQQLLDKFIIMDDVELAPAFTDESSLLILGTLAAEGLSALALPAIDPLHLLHADTPDGPVLLTAPAAGPVPIYELRAPAAIVQTLNDQLVASGIQQVSPETLEALRILSATPKYGIDIRNTDTNKDLPQETAQIHALHFSKGCYLGQEIVERIHSRGQVHRSFTQFKLTGTLPKLPIALEVNGKPAGELTSATRIGDTIVALGYARREALDTRQPLTYSGGTATPTRSESSKDQQNG